MKLIEIAELTKKLRQMAEFNLSDLREKGHLEKIDDALYKSMLSLVVDGADPSFIEELFNNIALRREVVNQMKEQIVIATEILRKTHHPSIRGKGFLAKRNIYDPWIGEIIDAVINEEGYPKISTERLRLKNAYLALKEKLIKIAVLGIQARNDPAAMELKMNSLLWGLPWGVEKLEEENEVE